MRSYGIFKRLGTRIFKNTSKAVSVNNGSLIPISNIVNNMPCFKSSPDYFIHGLGDSCLLFNIINIKEDIVINEKIKSIILIDNAENYKKTIAQIIKFVDPKDNYYIVELLFQLYIYINGFVEATKYNKENIENIEIGIVNSLKNIIYCNWYWAQEWPNKMDRMPYEISSNFPHKTNNNYDDRSKKILISACEHLNTMFTDNQQLIDFMEILNKLTAYNETEELNLNFLLYRSISNLVNYKDDYRHNLTSLLIDYFHYMLSIYYDFLNSIKNDIAGTDEETNIIYLKFIFQEFIDIYQLANIIISNINTNSIGSELQEFTWYNILFRNHFGHFILEYFQVDDIGNISTRSHKSIMNEISDRNKYLKYLLIDSHESNGVTTDDLKLFGLHTDHKSFDWVLLNFDTLKLTVFEDKFISKNRFQIVFSFKEKMKVLKFRRLVLEYFVMNTIYAKEMLK